MEWERGLDQSGLFSLLYIPHFSRREEVNSYVKKLLESFDVGYLWINEQIFVDVELIVVITVLPLPSIDPTPYLRKYQDTVLKTKMKDKYDKFSRHNRGFLITSIKYDHVVRFIVKVLASKLLCNMRLNQCTTGVVGID